MRSVRNSADQVAVPGGDLLAHDDLDPQAARPRDALRGDARIDPLMVRDGHHVQVARLHERQDLLDARDAVRGERVDVQVGPPQLVARLVGHVMSSHTGNSSVHHCSGAVATMRSIHRAWSRRMASVRSRRVPAAGAVDQLDAADPAPGSVRPSEADEAQLRARLHRQHGRPGRDARRSAEQLGPGPRAADHPVGHDAHAQAGREARLHHGRGALDGEHVHAQVAARPLEVVLHDRVGDGLHRPGHRHVAQRARRTSRPAPRSRSGAPRRSARPRPGAPAPARRPGSRGSRGGRAPGSRPRRSAARVRPPHTSAPSARRSRGPWHRAPCRRAPPPSSAHRRTPFASSHVTTRSRFRRSSRRRAPSTYESTTPAPNAAR